MDDTLKILPLQKLHIAAGAKFGPFAGWSMPLSYAAGVMAEHLHTRQKAGLFDITHMQLIEVAGPQSSVFLNRCCPIDVTDLEIGASKYTLLLNDTAGIIDDLIITRRGDNQYLVVVNAGRANVDIAHMKAIAADHDCTFRPIERVFLALQGPMAAAVLSDIGIDTGSMVFTDSITTENGVIINRSGYTGEDGFELALPLDQAKKFAETLVADERVMWIGLAARDSLRLEAGLCLYGQDLTEEITPVSARLMWAIPKAVRDGNFVGAKALRTAINEGAATLRVGIKPEGKQPVRAGTPLLTRDGDAAGTVTSGGFGPSAGHPVAMGYVTKQYAAAGTELVAEVRGKHLPVTITTLPFVPHNYHRGN